MAGAVPPVGTKGRWKLLPPYSTTPAMLYTLGADRYFIDIENQGTNVYDVYYNVQSPPIPKSKYQEDKAKGIRMLTLLSDTEAAIYVPSSFVAEYPTLDSIPYHHCVLSMSLGAVPVTMSLDFLITQLKATCSDTIGIEPEINVGVVPLLSVVTPEQHDTNEAMREAAILNRTTDYARYLAEKQKNARLQQQLNIYQEIIKKAQENGCI